MSRKITVVLLICILCMLAVGCGMPKQESIVGTWKEYISPDKESKSEPRIIYFISDGTGHMNIGNGEETFKYTVEDGVIKLKVKINGGYEDRVWDYKFEDDALFIKDAGATKYLHMYVRNK